VLGEGDLADLEAENVELGNVKDAVDQRHAHLAGAVLDPARVGRRRAADGPVGAESGSGSLEQPVGVAAGLHGAAETLEALAGGESVGGNGGGHVTLPGLGAGGVADHLSIASHIR
jgi:hypothetical protein